jgi:diacylglycerol diphosphate phosphatase/phosphatidate phosphatase
MARDERDRETLDMASKPGLLGAIVRFWHRSYAADYICLASIFAGWTLVSFYLFLSLWSIHR